MKRINELEENAKRVRREAKEEIARIKKTQSFIPLLNSDLAEWKQKLQETATPLGGSWKLIIYTQKDQSLLQYALHDYRPEIFSTKPWLVEEWNDPSRCSGNPVVVATANSADDLLPNRTALKRLSLFGLAFCVCPSDLDHPKTLEKLYGHVSAQFYSFGLGLIWRVDDIQFDVKSIYNIERPDLTNPDHVNTIYRCWEEEQRVLSNCRESLGKLATERAALCCDIDKKIALCQRALELRERILEVPQ